MAPESPSSWRARDLKLVAPSGLIAAVVAALIGAGGVGLVKAAAPDLVAVDTRIEAAANQIRREVYASNGSAEALAVARYDEILRRLDRIERRMDGSP